MCYISVNKNSGTKFYIGSRGSLSNPAEGTFFDEMVTDGDHDFYLVSKSTRQ